eukprot:4305318-Amphidinium_carterae.1
MPPSQTSPMIITGIAAHDHGAVASGHIAIRRQDVTRASISPRSPQATKTCRGNAASLQGMRNNAKVTSKFKDTAQQVKPIPLSCKKCPSTKMKTQIYQK